jgi:predicted  nucleic acid-binding Zn-ribbon protein
MKQSERIGVFKKIKAAMDKVPLIVKLDALQSEMTFLQDKVVHVMNAMSKMGNDVLALSDKFHKLSKEINAKEEKTTNVNNQGDIAR